MKKKTLFSIRTFRFEHVDAEPAGPVNQHVFRDLGQAARDETVCFEGQLQVHVSRGSLGPSTGPAVLISLFSERDAYLLLCVLAILVTIILVTIFVNVFVVLLGSTPPRAADGRL